MGKNSHYATGDPELQAAIDAILSQRKIILDHKILKEGMNERIAARTKTLNCQFLSSRWVYISYSLFF
jgi:precorrin isomerase